MESPQWGNAAWKCHMAGLHIEHISIGGLTVKQSGLENGWTVYYEYNGVALIWSQQQQKRHLNEELATAESMTQLLQEEIIAIVWRLVEADQDSCNKSELSKLFFNSYG